MRAVLARPSARPAAVIPALILALAATMVVAVGIGAVPVPPLELLRALTGTGDELSARIVLELRLPRVLVGALCGAMFAASGAMLQGIVRNPLASPDIVGVGAGAGLAAVIVMILVPSAPAWALPWAAFAGAWAGFAAVYALARTGRGVAPVRLALVGVAIGAALSAAQQLVLLRAPDSIGGALAFLAGTVYGADWPRLARVLPWALVLLPATAALARTLDVQGLGDGPARSVGHNIERGRLAALTVAVALAGAAVTGAGVLGFVGLVGPHAARLLTGPGHRRLLPASMLLGAALVVAADALGRGLLPPVEVPAGVLTTLIGAPYFLYLLKRQASVR